MGTDGLAIAFAAKAVNAFVLGLYIATTTQTLMLVRENMKASSCISTFWVLLTAIFLAVLSLGTDPSRLEVTHFLLFAQVGFVCGVTGNSREDRETSD